ncbi:MAG: hypothetical protein R3E97_12735 [Candidatus Eisenbacteria bacterium]
MRVTKLRDSLGLSPVFVLSTLLAVTSFPAVAGQNADGYLLLHTDDSVVYTSDGPSAYCDLLGSVCTADPDCTDDHFDCAQTLVGLNPTSNRGTDVSVFWAIAAFPPSSCPRVSAVQFGLSWPVDQTPVFVGHGKCGAFEVFSDGWPEYLGSGTAVTFEQPVARTGFPVYWFAAYSYYGGEMAIQIADFPAGADGAAFADDSIPAVLDEIPLQNRGSMGLNGASGSNPYRIPEVVGACCLSSGDCVLESVDGCEADDGAYQGDGTGCDPNPCNPTPTVGTTWGTLKSSFRE